MKRIVFVVVILCLLVACKAEDPLVFAVIPSEDAAMAREEWEPMVRYLSDGMGREVSLMLVADYASVVEAMRYGHADLARFSPVGYVMALDQGADIEIVAVAVKQETGLPGYYALLIARSETDTSDLSALTFGFVDVGSTSGYVAPTVHLRELGVDPKESVFAGSHNAVILAVQNGSVDVGAVASNRIAVALAEGVISEGEFQTVWQSDLIPNTPIAVQSSMGKGDKAKLRELFLHVPEDVALAAMTNESSYVELDDAAYDPVREILQFEAR